MMEIGPFRMDPDKPGSLTLLDWGGWEEFAGVVFGELNRSLSFSRVVRPSVHPPPRALEQR